MTQTAQNAPLGSENFITVPLDSVPVDIVLPYAVYVLVNQKFIALRAKGDRLQTERVKSLRDRNIDALYVSKAEWSIFMQELEASLDHLGVNESSKEAAMGLRKVLQCYWKEIEDDRTISATTFAKLGRLTNMMPVMMEKNRVLADTLLKRYRDVSLYFSNHSINISVYSVVIGLKLRLPMKELQELALSASTANLGIIKIPREILYKPGALTEDEWKIVREHPKHGYELLKQLLVSDKIALGALQHHERCDGGGYPNGLTRDNISLYARIISVAEVFNALTSARPWAEAMPAPLAVETMQKMVGKFDPSVLNLT